MKPEVVEFNETGGVVADGAGVVVMFRVALGVSWIVRLVEDGGRMVERLPVENDGTVE